MHKVLLTKRAEKELPLFPQPVIKRIAAALDDLTTLGIKSSNIKKLQTPFPGYRKRVGDYRILLEVNEEIIVVYRITKRAEAYR
jgi:mRNA interferase RelE/StbE